jgi:hypothetical protein
MSIKLTRKRKRSSDDANPWFWTKEQELLIKTHHDNGMSPAAIADQLQSRSARSIYVRLKQLKCIPHTERKEENGFHNRPYVKTIVYRLKCEENKHYIGFTTALDKRIGEHFIAASFPNIGITPVRWLQRYKPLALEEFHPGSIHDETTFTLECMRRFGFQNVRGAKWTCVEMTEPPPELAIFEREQQSVVS